MAEDIKTLDDLKDVVETSGGSVATAVSDAVNREPLRDSLGRSYATGKPKKAVG